MPTLVLASTSLYRRELLARLLVRFDVADPQADESVLPEEPPSATAERLAVAKAMAVASRFPDALIIGSDQVAFVANQRFGKPLVRERAIEQLRLMSGRTVTFHTGLCLLNSATGRSQVCGVPTEVAFRQLSDEEIERYLDKEQPYHCAGSAKSEGLGISLLSSIRGDDPNALIGLPLIALCRMLRAEGMQVP
ncbi:MAG: septum formation inhibitor Maf [Betaproteobacteria bacterium HGW-Betaproteobacteria-14]|nr:MAG: septum formation inhibitor Maf [Betaproteobacteria bacterium HGW-Betaproteobacteria-14]